MREITCPECGCHIHLEWKTKEEILNETNKPCCEMQKDALESNKEKVLGQYLAELTQRYDEEMEHGNKKEAKKVLKEMEQAKKDAKESKGGGK